MVLLSHKLKPFYFRDVHGEQRVGMVNLKNFMFAFQPKGLSGSAEEVRSQFFRRSTILNRFLCSIGHAVLLFLFRNLKTSVFLKSTVPKEFFTYFGQQS